MGNPEPSPAPAALTSPTAPTDAGFRGYYGRGSYYRNGHYGYNNTEIAPAEWSGSEEKPQGGGNGWGCCNRCWDWRCKHSPCCHKKKESESSPSEPAPAPAPAPSPAPAPALLTSLPQEGEEGWGCCNRCWSWICKHSPCCHKKKESESSPSEPAPAPAPAPAAPTDDPQEGGNGWPWGGCHRCWSPICKHSPCCHKNQESESSPSVSDLVKAGLEQLKAGNTLKFSVNIKNPQAIIDEAEALKGQKTSKGEIFTL